MRRHLLTVVLLCLALFSAGCKVDGKVTINLEEDLSGVVSIAIDLDPDAAEALGDPDSLEYQDLEAQGWTISVQQTDGGTTISAQKPFSEPEQLNAALNEIGGDPLVFHDWNVTSKEAFAASEVSIGGEITLTGSIEQFGDDDLAERLDGFRAGIPPLLQPEDEVNLEVELVTNGFEWDSVVGLSGTNGRASRLFTIGTGEAADVVVGIESSTQNGEPYLWIVGGGVGVLAAGGLLVLARRKD